MLKYELAHASGPIIKSLRKERRMTQQDLSVLMNVSRSVVANWEAKMRAPTTEQFCKLAGIFNVTTDFLIGRDQNQRLINAQENIIDINKLNSTGKSLMLKIYKLLMSDDNFTENSKNRKKSDG
ncbi:MAG: helix-turn-helix transcriptional regulator [Clostridia bacterium]|nr:helix-turn-helix transcriptional regulator [Clostridia bacterium]